MDWKTARSEASKRLAAQDSAAEAKRDDQTVGHLTREVKDAIRAAARQARRTQLDKDAASSLATERLIAMPPYRDAKCVMWYVDVRDEVRTRSAIPAAIASGKTVVVPFCSGDQLRLYHLRRWDDLSRGSFGILEPREPLRNDPGRLVDPLRVELVVVPGVAFDTRGGRLGYGRGFYDRLLSQVRPTTPLVGLAFECQIMAKLPQDEHDVTMDWVVTERRTIRCLDDTRVHADGDSC